jgi:hypothetical protein
VLVVGSTKFAGSKGTLAGSPFGPATRRPAGLAATLRLALWFALEPGLALAALPWSPLVPPLQADITNNAAANVPRKWRLLVAERDAGMEGTSRIDNRNQATARRVAASVVRDPT